MLKSSAVIITKKKKKTVAIIIRMMYNTDIFNSMHEGTALERDPERGRDA